MATQLPNVSRMYDRETAYLFSKSRYGGGECYSMTSAYEDSIAWMRRQISDRLYRKCEAAWSAVDAISARADRQRQTITMELMIGDAVIASGTVSVFTTRCGDEHDKLVRRLVDEAASLFTA